MLGRLADDLRAKGVSDDQAGVRRKYLAGHLDRGGEEQPVAVHPVVHPFLIGAEIRHRGLDLDNPDFAVGAERHEVGAAARRQRQLANHAEAMRMQEPRGAARDFQRGLRLPAVDRNFRWLDERDAHGPFGPLPSSMIMRVRR